MQRRTLLAAALGAVAAGCARLKEKEQLSRLDPTLTAYAGAIRWGSFENASGFVQPRDGSVPHGDASGFAGLKVTGFQVRVNRVNDARDEADVSLSFTYYHEDRATIRRVDQHSVWYYDAERGRWLLDGALPDFKR